LQGNLERMGCRAAVVLNLDARELCNTYFEYFDAVVCDAPCSGEGMFRKNEQAVSEWSVENVNMCAERQKSIMDSIEKCVKVGGYLLYSTCTFSLEENEMLVDTFLSEHENFELIALPQSITDVTAKGICYSGAAHDVSKTARFYPHICPGEGQFISLMKKTSASEQPAVRKDKAKNNKPGADRADSAERDALKVAQEFLKKHLVAVPKKQLSYRGGTVRLCPECPLPEYGVLMHGVCVGEVVKGRLVPHHQLFSAYGSEFKNKLCLSSNDPRVAEYIKGMEIDVSDIPEISDGYMPLMVDGCALGGVKISGGKAKNHYPKGLRTDICRNSLTQLDF